MYSSQMKYRKCQAAIAYFFWDAGDEDKCKSLMTQGFDVKGNAA